MKGFRHADEAEDAESPKCKKRGNLREMEIIDRGKITLLREWHEANSWFYVESPFFTGYLESEFEINNMLTYLRSCKTFKLEFDEGSKLNYKNLPDLILFFNKNCPD